MSPRSEEHEFSYPCPEHSGVVTLLKELKAGQIQMWDKLDDALKRWPPGATILLSVMSGIVGVLLGVVLGRGIK